MTSFAMASSLTPQGPTSFHHQHIIKLNANGYNLTYMCQSISPPRPIGWDHFKRAILAFQNIALGVPGKVVKSDVFARSQVLLSQSQFRPHVDVGIIGRNSGQRTEPKYNAAELSYMYDFGTTRSKMVRRHSLGQIAKARSHVGVMPSR